MSIKAARQGRNKSTTAPRPHSGPSGCITRFRVRIICTLRESGWTFPHGQCGESPKNCGARRAWAQATSASAYSTGLSPAAARRPIAPVRRVRDAADHQNRGCTANSGTSSKPRASSHQIAVAEFMGPLMRGRGESLCMPRLGRLPRQQDDPRAQGRGAPLPTRAAAFRHLRCGPLASGRNACDLLDDP